MDLSRRHIVETLRRAGLKELADTAEATLPDVVDDKTANQFLTAHGVSMSTLTDRMGGSP